MYKVYRTNEFEKDFDSLDKEDRKRVEKIENQLSENPIVGDSLSYDFFREKRMNGTRVYFLVYEDYKVILLVAMSDKKSQPETIDKIKELLPEYRREVEKLI